MCVCFHMQNTIQSILTFGRINGDKWTHSMLRSVSAQNVGFDSDVPMNHNK